MRELTVSEAGARLDAVIEKARATHHPVFLTQHGRRVAAVVDVDQLETLLDAAEDLADLQAAAAARAEISAANEGAMPWSQVKAELGLR